MLTAAAAAAAAAPAASALAGCSGGSGGSGSGGRALSFVYMGTAEAQAQWNALFEEFNKVHPEIELAPEAIPSDGWAAFFNKVSTNVAGGKVPDIIQVATEGQRLFASKGLLEPLNDFIAQDQDLIDEYFADLDPNLIAWNEKHASPGGETFYLPGEFNTMTMHCNNDLFAQAGVPLPTGGWTWDEFRAACEQINSATGALAYYAEPAYFVGIMPWLLTNGVSSFNDDWSEPTFDAPGVVEAAEFTRALVADELSPPPGGTFDAFTAFAQGKLAMFGGGRWPVISLRNLDAVDNTTIVPWPTKVQQGSPVGWNGYPILKASQNKEDAWIFIKFLISKEGSSFFAQLGGTIVPARQSVASSPAFLDESPPGTEELYAALAYATPIPSPDEGAAVQTAIENAWEQILVGNTPAAAGTAAAQQELAGLV